MPAFQKSRKKSLNFAGIVRILFQVPPPASINLTKHDIPDLRCTDAVSWSYEKSLNPLLAFFLMMQRVSLREIVDLVLEGFQYFCPGAAMRLKKQKINTGFSVFSLTNLSLNGFLLFKVIIPVKITESMLSATLLPGINRTN
ncbi:MAG TPA: hypothetical protein PK573_10575 [Spirochaetota bacterium]|nr:hypothetical protein [Spirochaetota bacterium]HSA14138.1 hypothetical protein [Spirochaetota bacterium]